MHPLETNGAKQDDWTTEQIERVTDTVWISLARFNELVSRQRHTAANGDRFAYLLNFGGWRKVRVC